MGIDYSRIMPLLIEAVKEMISEVDLLKSASLELGKTISEMNERLEKPEKQPDNGLLK